MRKKIRRIRVSAIYKSFFIQALLAVTQTVSAPPTTSPLAASLVAALGLAPPLCGMSFDEEVQLCEHHCSLEASLWLEIVTHIFYALPELV